MHRDFIISFCSQHRMRICVWLKVSVNVPQHKSPLDVLLHLFTQMLHIGLSEGHIIKRHKCEHYRQKERNSRGLFFGLTVRSWMLKGSSKM